MTNTILEIYLKDLTPQAQEQYLQLNKMTRQEAEQLPIAIIEA